MGKRTLRNPRTGETVTSLETARDTDEVYTVEAYRPALQMQEFFEALIGWASDGRTDEAGMPCRFRRAVLHRHFRRGIRSRSRRRNFEAWLPAPVGTLLGYRRELECYIRSV